MKDNQIYKQRGRHGRVRRINQYQLKLIFKGSERIRITSTGNFMMGTVAPSHKLHIGK